MEIDLKKKKTEYEWNKAFDNFWLKATPLWFDWLKWVAILGGITFLSNTTNNYLLKIASNVSYLMLFFYLQSFFFSIEFKGFPFIKNERVTRVISIFLSAIISALLFSFLGNLTQNIHGK